MKKSNYILCLSNSVSLFIMFSLFLFGGCQNNDSDIGTSGHNSGKSEVGSRTVNGNVTSEILKEFNAIDLLAMKAYLEEAGINTSGWTLPLTEGSTKGLISDALLYAIKVTTKSPHPGDPTKQIDLSGVLLVPRIALTSLRLVVAPVPTYLANSQAPSNIFANNISLIQDGSLNFLYFWTLQAYQGFAVLLPDYPGYGDSYQQCFIPYVVQEPMVNAAIDITKATQSVMTSRGYRYKPELIITGFSQGSFVATSLARELELNPDHGLGVNLLVAGGTPADLVYMVDTIRHSEEYTYPLIVPYMACGFKSNGYPDIDFSAIMKEPYDSDSLLYGYLDGTHTDLDGVFPEVVSEFLTEDAIYNWETSPSLAVIRDAISENSIQPWVNQCKMVMVHGAQDVTVNYMNAKTFADRMNALGGDVSFHTVLGDHTFSAVPYYLDASVNLLLYK